MRRDPGKGKQQQYHNNRNNRTQPQNPHPAPTPQMAVYATVFHKLNPNLALGLRFEFQSAPHHTTTLLCCLPSFIRTICEILPSSFLCLLIWQLLFIIHLKIFVSKLLRQKVFDRLKIISKIKKETTSYIVL